ncbi:MAG TPA: Gfo/Idh/MocA family oxidoreductase [Streptomyces sp.]|nr:Gfo/Idh/MocA family oxidoreductase [Streptomyces sp.]
MTGAPLGLGLVGAGGFATFLAQAAASLPDVSLRTVADPRPGAASDLARAHGARVAGAWRDVLANDDVDAVVVATPPAGHAEIAKASLEAGKHVFCEKPLALDDADARDLVATVERTGRVLVVDHVLRYNPLLRALTRLPGALLPPVQRFCFENDASDEDLDAGHWFWDEAVSGGIFVEHGVHFFDAAAMLLDREPTSVLAAAARRPHGPVDLVSATVTHGEDALATHTHSFTHANRCERQLMRLDCGAAEVRVEGWIPVHAVVDAWTDDVGLRAAEGLPDRVTELLDVPGFRLGPVTGVRVSIRRNVEPAPARGRGAALDLPHHVRIELTLGGHDAKAEAYAESVRAAMTDLVARVADGGRPQSGAREGAAAVAVATAATRSARRGRAEPISRTPVAVH